MGASLRKEMRARFARQMQRSWLNAARSRRVGSVRHLNSEGGHIVCGTNPCNWAVIERAWGKEGAVSVQRMLQDMADAGYKATDLGDLGFMTDAKSTLDAAGVEMMG